MCAPVYTLHDAEAGTMSTWIILKEWLDFLLFCTTNDKMSVILFEIQNISMKIHYRKSIWMILSISKLIIWIYTDKFSTLKFFYSSREMITFLFNVFKPISYRKVNNNFQLHRYDGPHQRVHRQCFRTHFHTPIELWTHIWLFVSHLNFGPHRTIPPIEIMRRIKFI